MSNDASDSKLDHVDESPYRQEYEPYSPYEKSAYLQKHNERETTHYGPEYGRSSFMSTFSPAQAADDVFSFIGMMIASLIVLWFVGFFGGVVLSLVMLLISSMFGFGFDPFDHPLSFPLLAVASLCLLGVIMHWTDPAS